MSLVGSLSDSLRVRVSPRDDREVESLSKFLRECVLCVCVVLCVCERGRERTAS